MKYLFFLLPLLISSVSVAQNVDVSPTGASAENTARNFTFTDSNLLIQGSTLTVTGPADRFQINQAYSYAVSPKGHYFGALHIDNDLRAKLVDGRGSKIGDIELTYFDPFDETLKISIFDDGKFITRDNVANFSFFDSDGTLRYNTSNSSGSPDGEVMSEIASDPAGNTILLYNPRINYGTDEGSRARIVKGEDKSIEIFSSRNRTIKFSDVTDNGSYLTLITERHGTPDEVLVTDRFGNKITSFTTDEELSGATLAEDGKFITIYSTNRIQVYRLEDMETLGSTSTRVHVNYATYSDQDQQILALCGDRGNTNQIVNPQIQVISLSQRSIATTDLAFPLSFLDFSHLKVDRIASNRFQMTGLNRELTIETSF